MTEREDFLTRWSRRKREAKVDPADPGNRETPVAPIDANPKTLAALPESATGETSQEIFDLSKLPSLDSIGPATDIRVFLQAGVPDALSRAALRRAWSADPGIRDFIGLSENSWDFTANDGVHGFGALDPAEVKRLLANLLGDSETEREGSPHGSQAAEARNDEEPADAGSAEANSGASEAIADQAGEQRAPAGDELLQASNSMADHAALQKETAEALPAPVPLRRPHGRALPQ